MTIKWPDDLQNSVSTRMSCNVFCPIDTAYNRNAAFAAYRTLIIMRYIMKGRFI